METLKESLSQYASSGLILRFSLYFVGFFITIVIQNSIISIDEMKKWAYFIAAIMVNETIPSLTGIFTITFYIILLYFAVDIPFSIRFGVKKGAQIKCIILVAALLCVVIYLLFGPLPDSADVIFDAVYGTIEKLINNQFSDEMMLVMGIIPIISVFGYIASYFISCKLFMKGVEEYDK